MLKKILVPTDFSECAQYAADAAVNIAARIDAEVLFYTRVDVHPLWDQIKERSKRDFPESFARIHEAKVKFHALRQQYDNRPVKISFSYSHGDLVQNIIETIDREQIYMIIMGSQGADGHVPQLFGSNTQKVVKHAHCPVMVIKQAVPDVQFKHIVFASDFRPEAKQPFSRLIEFARYFGATLHLLNLDAPHSFQENGHDAKRDILAFRSLCGDLPCLVHDLSGIKEEQGLSHLTAEVEADLVSLAHYGIKPLKRIFTSSLTEALVNQLETPILTLNTHELHQNMQGQKMGLRIS